MADIIPTSLFDSELWHLESRTPLEIAQQQLAQINLILDAKDILSFRVSVRGTDANGGQFHEYFNRAFLDSLPKNFPLLPRLIALFEEMRQLQQKEVNRLKQQYGQV